MQHRIIKVTQGKPKPDRWLNLDLNLDPNPSLDLALNLSQVLNLALNLSLDPNLAQNLSLDPNLALNLALHLNLALTLDPNLALNSSQDLNLDLWASSGEAGAVLPDCVQLSTTPAPPPPLTGLCANPLARPTPPPS